MKFKEVIMKTAAEKSKAESGIPPVPVKPTTPTQHGPEDGRDQNISPGSNSYEPNNGEIDRGNRHNREVFREGEKVQDYGKTSNEGQ